MLWTLSEVRPVVLWTDALIYLLIITVLGGGWYARSRQHLLTPWREVLRKPLGMCALMVLILYLFIGLVDSIHYKPRIGNDSNGKAQYAVQIWSLLDAALITLKEHGEKTYSAPFAAQLYMKETVEEASGNQRREFPRLQYGGGHLADPMRERVADVWWRVTNGIGAGLMTGIGMTLLISGFLSIRYQEGWTSVVVSMFKGHRDLPWRSLLGMGVAILMFLGFLISTTGYYHVFGTDKIGEDVLYQSLKSIRTGLVIGTLTTLVMLPFAILLGIMAGYFKGWVDDVIQYIYTTLNSIPGCC